jgi:ankyrin repeat protein
MNDELRDAIRAGDLPSVRLLVQGGASIAGTRVHLSALNLAAKEGQALIVEWLLEEGGASIEPDASDATGKTILQHAARPINYFTTGSIKTVKWLLEHRGADIMDGIPAGLTVFFQILPSSEDAVMAHLISLLRVMILRSAPPQQWRMFPHFSRVVEEEGAWLRARLPAYVARRQTLQ